MKKVDYFNQAVVGVQFLLWTLSEVFIHFVSH